MNKIKRKGGNMIEEESRTELSKYYRYTKVCSVCQKQYGKDTKHDNKHCPTCINRLKIKGGIA